MYRKIGLVCGCLVLSALAQADVGIGVGVSDDRSTLYVPYKLSDSVFLEAGLSYQSDDFETLTTNADSEIYELSLGFFGTLPEQDKVNLYYGIRFGYLDGESTSRLTVPSIDMLNPFRAFVGTAPSIQTIKSEISGYSVSPLLGASYALTPSFSIAGELMWSYREIDDEYSNVISNSVVTSKNKNDQSKLEAQVVVRYFF